MRLYFDYYCTHAHVIYTYMHIDGFFFSFSFQYLERYVYTYMYVAFSNKECFKKVKKIKTVMKGKDEAAAATAEMRDILFYRRFFPSIGFNRDAPSDIQMELKHRKRNIFF